MSAPVHLVQGREIAMPVEVRDARVAAATWLVPAGPARRLVAGTGLEPAAKLGRAILSLAFIEYRDGDLGEYNEIAVALVCRPESGGPAAPYIHRLPVNQGFTLEAGVSIWGFPKWMTESDISWTPSSRVELRDDGQYVLSCEVKPGWIPLPARPTSMNTYSFRDGVLRRTRWETSNHGGRARPGGARLRLGRAHPMAAELASLGLPKRAFMTTTVARMQARFHEPEIL